MLDREKSSHIERELVASPIVLVCQRSSNLCLTSRDLDMQILSARLDANHQVTGGRTATRIPVSMLYMST